MTTMVKDGWTRVDAWASNPRALLFAVMIVAALARIIAMIALADVHPASAVLWEYGEEARCALQNHTDLCAHYKNHAFGVYPTAYMPPVLSYANFSIRP